MDRHHFQASDSLSGSVVFSKTSVGDTAKPDLSGICFGRLLAISCGS